jgi:predicted PurR-regulated permease PerM
MREGRVLDVFDVVVVVVFVVVVVVVFLREKSKLSNPMLKLKTKLFPQKRRKKHTQKKKVTSTKA